ncbi:hypothetical protein F4820DRAFT_426508 [Hypoxylon rubiginosum]|uniref:Uncharacterized protein n=1 Tax=Hypoxylon rubiginosum TaxID=110542 RepID=A0ACB9YW56_9PEZI|nr:hypothetical protein F4820DRAFT_426508 [Hypoxylon rubiginosum]
MLSHLYKLFLDALKWPFNTRETRPSVPTFDFIDQNKQLATLLNRSEQSTVIFVAIEAHFLDQAGVKTVEIGLSTWCPDIISSVECHHWIIQHDISLENGYNSSIFQYGTTQVVTESQIKSILSRYFESLESHFTTISVVGYNIHSTLEILEKHWRVPDSTIVLDTQNIWQSLHGRTCSVPLEQALETTHGVKFSRHLLNNAGNDSRYIIDLLLALGELI